MEEQAEQPKPRAESDMMLMLRRLYGPAEKLSDGTQLKTTTELMDVMRQVCPDSTTTATELATELRIGGYRLELMADLPMWLLQPVEGAVL